MADQPLWRPDPAAIAATQLSDFMRVAGERHGRRFDDYDALYQWSVADAPAFWSLLWDYAGVIGERGEPVLVDGDRIEQARWFPQAKLNFAENLLRHRGPDGAIVFRAEDQVALRELSYDDLHEQVRRLADWLRRNGLEPGDRVAGYLPNLPETIVAMLATTALGGVWTSTSPDFGVDSVVERFGQTTPRFLISANGYYYNGKEIDIRDKIEAVQAAIPSIEQTLIVDLIPPRPTRPGLAWHEVLDAAGDDELTFVPRGFNDPLYILYSSGTTGKPKCITHKVGGVLLQHLKEHMLHCDVRAGETVFYFTTCGWMMWNWLVSALALGARVALYEGSPFAPDGNVLWDYADEAGFSLFGTSAKYIDALHNQGLSPARTHRLDRLRMVCSTGSVLSPESFRFVYSDIKQDLCLASISGGTDIVSCFVLGCPIRPVYAGESQCRGLGLAVDVFNDAGEPVRGEKGELVCTRTFPCQPAGFWGDTDGKKYHNAYFAVYDNIWHHGDYVELTAHDGVIIYGRSDATLNPGGVRIGTAEIYRHVESLEAVEESIVIGQDWDNDVRVVLFVVLAAGRELDEALVKTIRTRIRERCSPRHVPAVVLQVPEIPRTKSGKIVELAVREVVHGRDVKNIQALANPEALEYFRDRPELAP